MEIRAVTLFAAVAGLSVMLGSLVIVHQLVRDIDQLYAELLEDLQEIRVRALLQSRSQFPLEKTNGEQFWVANRDSWTGMMAIQRGAVAGGATSRGKRESEGSEGFGVYAADAGGSGCSQFIESQTIIKFLFLLIAF
jgi:hypothetical protein